MQQRYLLLWVQVDAVDVSILNSLICSQIEKGKKVIIANHNFHSIFLFHHDEKMRCFYTNASYTHIDSMPLVYLGRLLGLPLQRKHRVAYIDWIRPLMAEAANHGWRVFFLGGKPGVGEKAAQILKKEFPGLQIRTAHGYFDAHPESPENRERLRLINEFKPHILLVGMGMPRQEHWILDNFEQLQANVILNCGACMDFVAGEQPTPPRWLGALGLEWLYRLLSDPKRLWRRYLVEPWFVLKLFVKEFWRRRILRKSF